MLGPPFQVVASLCDGTDTFKNRESQCRFSRRLRQIEDFEAIPLFNVLLRKSKFLFGSDLFIFSYSMVNLKPECQQSIQKQQTLDIIAYSDGSQDNHRDWYFSWLLHDAKNCRLDFLLPSCLEPRFFDDVEKHNICKGGFKLGCLSLLLL